MYQIEHYLTASGRRDLYIDWLRRPRDTRAKVTIVRRVARIERAVGYWQDWQLRGSDEKQVP